MSFAVIGIGVGVAGIGASLYGASQQSKAIKEASKTSAKATQKSTDVMAEAAERATDVQLQMFEEAKAMQMPYFELGKRTIPKYEETLGPDFANPLYQWELKQGQKAIDQALAKRGIFSSGAAAETHRNYVEQLTSRYGYEAYQRYLDALKIGSGASGQAGLWATQTGANVGSTYMTGGQTQSQLQAAGGQTQAQLQLAGGANQAQMWSGIAGIPGSTLGTYMNYEMMNRLFPQTSGMSYSQGVGLQNYANQFVGDIRG